MDNKINLPKTWAVAKLVDIAHINMGQSPSSPTKFKKPINLRIYRFFALWHIPNYPLTFP